MSSGRTLAGAGRRPGRQLGFCCLVFADTAGETARTVKRVGPASVAGIVNAAIAAGTVTAARVATRTAMAGISASAGTTTAAGTATAAGTVRAAGAVATGGIVMADVAFGSDIAG